METKCLQCDICGGKLEMDAGGQTATCSACGMTHSLARMREKIQEIRGHVTVDGPVVVQGIEGLQDLLHNANTYMELGLYDKASEVYKRITEKFPDSPEGWWGNFVVRVSQLGYRCPDWNILIHADSFAQLAMKLYDYSHEYNEIWNSIIERYGREVHFDKTSKYLHDELSASDIQLIEMSDRSVERFPFLKDLKKSITESYIRAFEQGNLTFFESQSNSEDMKKVIERGVENAKMINKEDEFCDITTLQSEIVYNRMDYKQKSMNKVYWPFQSFCDKPEKNQKDIEFSDLYLHFDFFLGNTALLSCPHYRNGAMARHAYVMIYNQAFSVPELLNRIGYKRYYIDTEFTAVNINKYKIKNPEICPACGLIMEKKFGKMKCYGCGKIYKYKREDWCKGW